MKLTHFWDCIKRLMVLVKERHFELKLYARHDYRITPKVGSTK